MESRFPPFGLEAMPLEANVIASKRITSHTHGILVEKPEGFSFRPTQFTILSIGAHARPMSIATSPTRSHLEYAVRLSESPFKRAFSSLSPGDKVQLRGPFGRFLLQEDRPAVLVAGGIGITPLKGMAEYASDTGLQIPVRLLYSNRTLEDAPFLDELRDLEVRNPSFRLLHTLTGGGQGSGVRVGRIGADLLDQASRGLDHPVYYVCGKPGLVAEVLRLLSQLGVPDDDLATEVFRGYAT